MRKVVVVGFVCDKCGNERRGSTQHSYDALKFDWRSGEEDGILIDASCICEDCFFGDEEFQNEIVEIVKKIKSIFPYAEINLGAAWRGEL